MSAATGKPSDAVAAIERELASIWTAPDPSTGIAKVRASNLNYVAASGAAALDDLRAMTDQLAETHAGRVLLLSVDPRLPPWAIAHEVSGVCRPSAGTSVCNDRVEIAFGVVAAERAASIVRTLALPEIPVVAEIAEGAPSTLAYALAGVARRLVVDSRRMRLGPIAELYGQARGTIADRAWVRAFSWRELVARFFDDHPAASLGIRRVHITRGPRTGGADPAHLLLGWLSSRLGWTEIGRGGARRSDGGVVEVAVEEAPDGLAPAGELASVLIEAGQGTGLIECEVKRVGDGRDVHWCLRRPGEARPGEGCPEMAREMALGHRDETWVLVKAIESAEGDRAYRDAVVCGARWETWWG